MENNKDVLLEVRNFCQYFGKTKAVDGVSFTIRGNYLWCNPQFGVVLKNPEVLKVEKAK